MLKLTKAWKGRMGGLRAGSWFMFRVSATNQVFFFSGDHDFTKWGEDCDAALKHVLPLFPFSGLRISRFGCVTLVKMPPIIL